MVIGIVKVERIIATLLLAIAFCPYIGSTAMSAWISYGCVAVIIGCAIVKLISTKKIAKELHVVLWGNLTIKIIIYLYSLCLAIFGIISASQLGTNLQTYINSVAAVCYFYLFGDKAYRSSLVAFIVASVVTVLSQMPYGNIKVHDLSLAGGFIFINFFCLGERITKKNIKYLIVTIAVLLISSKSISVLSLGVVSIISFVYGKLGKKEKKRLLKFCGLSFVFVIYLYVALVIDGKFFDIIESLGIFTSGRIYYYRVAEELASFSVTFIGYGRNALSHLFATKYSYMRVGNIHSDILRMYVECGFCIFALWIYNYFSYFPRKLEKISGTRVVFSYMLCSFYLFMTYMTDNTELYTVTQFFYIMIILECIRKEKIKTKSQEKQSNEQKVVYM